ncbi:head GIN domain-containing protein [Mucilaginibacter antarcticus]|uniref:Head GIN domain-containing protein n=1 Tax=Mucilaginibacter antarcticus TaxID=1855725 RepID=A0ABW5XRD6_9SPHI
MKITHYNLLAIVASAATLMFTSCKISCEKGSGNITTDTRTVTDFNKLDVSGAYKIILKQDSSLTVSVTADDNLQKFIKTEVSGDKLRITTNKKSICTSGDITVTIGVRHLEKVDASGAVNVTTDGKLVAKNFDFDLSGATNINMDLDAADVHTDGSGVTDITLRGQASRHVIALSGGGKIHAFDFIVGSYDISTSGASDCDINVLRELTVNSSGASSINYKGNPTTVNNKKTGVSSIKKVE